MSTQLVDWVFRTQLGLEAHLVKELKGLDLSFGRWHVLRSILDGGVSPSLQQVADIAGLHRTTVKAAVVALESRGYVTTSPSVVDRRTIEVVVTSAGSAAFHAGERIIQQVDHAGLMRQMGRLLEAAGNPRSAVD